MIARPPWTGALSELPAPRPGSCPTNTVPTPKGPSAWRKRRSVQAENQSCATVGLGGASALQRSRIPRRRTDSTTAARASAGTAFSTETNITVRSISRALRRGAASSNTPSEVTIAPAARITSVPATSIAVVRPAMLSGTRRISRAPPRRRTNSRRYVRS